MLFMPRLWHSRTSNVLNVQKLTRDLASQSASLQNEVNEFDVKIENVERDIENVCAERETNMHEIELMKPMHSTLQQEIQELEAELANFKGMIADASITGEHVIAQKANLHHELACDEKIVIEEQKVAVSAAERTRQAIAKLQVEQETTCEMWEAVQNECIEMQGNLSVRSHLEAEEHQKRDAIKQTSTDIRNNLGDVQQHLRHRQEDLMKGEEELVVHHDHRMILTKELASIVDQHDRISKEHADFEHVLAEERRTEALVSRKLDGGKEALKCQIHSFQEECHDASAKREELLEQRDSIRDTLGKFFPKHFALQTEYATRKREVEVIRHENEMLRWGQQKLYRDLEMLMKSYQTPAFV